MNIRKTNRLKRAQRSRVKMTGTEKRPRLAVNKSLKHIDLQIIDDVNNKSLGGFSTKAKKYGELDSQKQIDTLAKDVCKLAKEKSIGSMIFDRSGHPYKGNLALLADAIRKNGVEI